MEKNIRDILFEIKKEYGENLTVGRSRFIDLIMQGSKLSAKLDEYQADILKLLVLHHPEDHAQLVREAVVAATWINSCQEKKES